jgi:multiple sugar transport system permease protein
MKPSSRHLFAHYALLALLALFCVGPIVVIFATSLRQQVQIFAEPLNFLFVPTLENYRAVLTEDKFDRYLVNS